MGGCRCTFRNCSSRTDGNTHLFHYPVFNRARCHQWLVNADRLEFLNLKLSQLKNRVICQHHFVDNDFMNCLKSRLKPSAVPILYGPNCENNSVDGNVIPNPSYLADSTKYNLKDIEEPRPKQYLNFTYDEFLSEGLQSKVHNDLMYGSHKENSGFSKENTVKVSSYKPRGFTNNQTAAASLSADNIFNETTKSTNQGEKSNSLKSIDCKINVLSDEYIKEPIILPKTLKKVSLFNIVKPSRNENNTIKISKPQIIFDEILDTNLIKQIESSGLSNVIEEQINLQSFDKEVIVCHNDQAISNHCNINQLSGVHGNNLIEVEINTNSWINTQTGNVVQIQESNEVTQHQIKENMSAEKTTPKTAKLYKTKIKKVSKDIEEKRKFNMKLRDVLEAQVAEIEKEKKKLTSTPKKSDSTLTDSILNQDITSYLSEEPKLPSKDEFNVSAIEARINRMENLLLRKIEQNSERIVDLKSSLSKSPSDKKVFSKSTKRSVCTQSNLDEESHKKQLYQEISKYLSPNASSLIYEELFINKYSLNNSNTSLLKRKKRR